jgi:hypothetical protein
LSFKKSLFSVAVAALLLASGTQAQAALSTSTTFGPVSTQAGAYTIDFGTSPVNNSTSVVGSSAPNDVIYSGTAQGNSFQYVDGALYNNTSLISGIAARPVGAIDNYLSVGNSGTSSGPSSLTFSQGLSYFGFLWGSPDAYNTVTFWNGSTQLGSFDGSAVLTPPNGDQSFSSFFNVSATGGDLITKVTFASNGMAFETDNHAFVTAVPEAETYAMMLAGLGLMGAVVRRRKSRNV